MSKISGVVLSFSKSLRAVQLGSAVESCASVADLIALKVGKPKILKPSWLLSIASASAKARECSKTDIPVSVITGRPCKAQERVSIVCPTQRLINSGHSSDEDPLKVESGSARTMPTARHDA